MNSNFNILYIDGLWTQWAFHKVQEHPKRSSLLSFILIFIFIQFTFSLFIYVFTIHLRISLLCIQYSLFNIHYYVFIIMYLLFIHYALFTMHYALFTMRYALFIRIHTYLQFYTYSYVFTISCDEIP